MPVSVYSVGDSAIAGAAALLAVYELWLFSRHRARVEHLWIGIISLAACAYSSLMALHYNVGPDAALLLCRLEGGALGVAGFSCMAWALTTTGRATRGTLAMLLGAGVVLVGLTLSPWLIVGVHAVQPVPGGHVFWRRDVTVGVIVLQTAGLALVFSALLLTFRAPPERRSEARHFQLGVGLWSLSALHAVLSTLLRHQTSFSTIEYGFTALAASLVSHDARRFMQALAASERVAESTITKHRALASLHDDVVSSIHDGVLVLDDQQRVKLWNPVAARLTGAGPELTLDRPLLDVLRLSAPDRSLLAASLCEAANGRASTTPPLTQGDGKEAMSVVWAAAPFGSGASQRGVLAVLRDVTAEQAAKAALIRSEKNSRALIENLPDAVAVVDAERVLYVNAALSKLLGLAPDDTLSILRAERLVHQTDRERLRALRGGGPPVELRLAARNESVTAEVHCVPIEFDGAPVQALIARDVTQRNEITARMMELDRMVAVGTLAAGVGHEINNPLAYVTSNLEELQRSLADSHSEAANLVQEALHGSRRIRDIVRAISGLSRAGAERRAISLGEAVQSATAIAGNEIRHHARLSVDHEQDLFVVANEAELGQVLLNLLVNACHAVREGGREANQIRVRTYRENGYAVCEVTDTGCGIPVGILPRIFDPFFTTKPIGQGTGLGLSICRQTVRACGGEIEVASELGVGTTFRIVLPLAQPAEARPSPSHPDATHAPRRFRVMLVDDDERLLRALARPLRRHFELILCVSADEALERIEREADLDAVVTDLMMPGTSGMELYDAVLARYPRVAERMLFTTGGAFTAGASAFCSSMGKRVLPKPISIAELIERVRERALSSEGTG